MLRCKAKPGDEVVVFVDRQLTVLADILAERFFADGFQDLLGEVVVSAIEEINTSGHHRAQESNRSTRLKPFLFHRKAPSYQPANPSGDSCLCRCRRRS